MTDPYFCKLGVIRKFAYQHTSKLGSSNIGTTNERFFYLHDEDVLRIGPTNLDDAL